MGSSPFASIVVLESRANGTPTAFAKAPILSDAPGRGPVQAKAPCRAGRGRAGLSRAAPGDRVAPVPARSVRKLEGYLAPDRLSEEGPRERGAIGEDAGIEPAVPLAQDPVGDCRSVLLERGQHGLGSDADAGVVD